MHFNNQYQLNAYTFVITTVLIEDGRYRGRILFSQRCDNGTVRGPTILIETPGALTSIHAIRVEASNYAKQLILSGALCTILHAQIKYRSKKNITAEHLSPYAKIDIMHYEQ